MVKFYAHKFTNLAKSLAYMAEIAPSLIEDFQHGVGQVGGPRDSRDAVEFLRHIGKQLQDLGCGGAAKAAERLAGDLYLTRSAEVLKSRVEELHYGINDALKEQLFL